MLRRTLHSQRSQSMTEFALIAPMLFLLLFGIVDFGRVVYYYVTLSQAANEGARVAVRGLPPDYDTRVTNADVEAAIRVHSTALSLANPCPNGPIQNPVPPANQGWIFITEAPAPTAYEPSPPPNAPGLQPTTTGDGTCNGSKPASNNVPLQVTIYYNFRPITPLLQQVLSGHIVISAYAVYRTEY